VVCCGGGGQRWGGIDLQKPRLELAINQDIISGGGGGGGDSGGVLLLSLSSLITRLLSLS